VSDISLPPPLLLPIKEAIQWSRLSRAALYRRMKTGDIAAVKLGHRTFIRFDSLREFLAKLPSASFRS
jgi:hypothetical protein